jgi:glycerate-2-kinase
MNSDRKANLERIFQAGIEAVRPERLIARALEGAIEGTQCVPRAIETAGRIFILAIGKASIGMAGALDERLRSRIAAGILVAPKDMEADRSSIGRIRPMRGDHPLPGESSQSSARAALAMLESAKPDDLVIVALSGGASALCALPAKEITLADKIAANDLLLRAGAPIGDFNIVRKHISALKGGRLLEHCGGATVIGLILSDVRGNDPATIGSGLTSLDLSTYCEARNVLKRLQIWGRTPERIRDHLDRGAAGKIAQTPKAGDQILARVTNAIVGDNRTALEAALRAASETGYQVQTGPELDGDAEAWGVKIAGELHAMAGGLRRCVIGGGETTVIVQGPGRGGRAQQSALAIALQLDRLRSKGDIAVLVAGTDGVDGPTDAAGAFAFSDTVQRAKAAGFDAAESLKRNNAYALFDSIGDLFQCGPTGTNVADLMVALRD